MSDYLEKENTFPASDEAPIPAPALKDEPAQKTAEVPAEPTDDCSAPDEKKPKKQQKKRKKKTTSQLLLGFLIKLAAIAMAVWALLTFVLCLNIHYGNNMYPALKDGDLVISLRLQKLYLNAAVQYAHDGKLCLGRVIGMPGDVIDISDEGALTVNGVAPAEEIFYPTFRCETADISYPYTVGEDQAFILNDFRSDTNDSRAFGAVNMKDVKGPLLIMLRRRSF